MRVDWVSFIEAAYRDEPDAESWARGVLEAAPATLRQGSPSLAVLEHAADCQSSAFTLFVGEHPAFNADVLASKTSPAVVRALYYPPAIVNMMSEVISRETAEVHRWMQEYAQRYMRIQGGARSLVEALGIVVHPQPGVALVLSAAYSGDMSLTRHERRLLTQTALHLETAYRLRVRPEAVVAVISAGGKLLHRADGAPDDAEISARVADIERARLRRHRSTPDALDLWRALVAGRASIVERSDGGRRHYLVVDNAPATQPMRALSRAELDVVSYAARGLSAKLVGYALGIAQATVSERLANASRKIGVASRIELVRLAAMLTRDPRARFERIALTTTERDVLALLAQGLSNREIAAIRNRSMRTIANQVASLLRKTESPTRRALVAVAYEE